MPDFTNLMLVIAIVVLTINGVLMVVPNPETNGYGISGVDVNSLSWMLPVQVTSYANVHDFSGQNQGSLGFNNIGSIDSGANQAGKLPIIGPLIDFFGGPILFVAQILFGFLIALSAAGVPAPLLLIIGIPLIMIEIYGVVYFVMQLAWILRGII